MKQLGSEEARRRFRDLLDDAQRGEAAEISRNGKLVAVLVPANWYYAPAEVIWPQAEQVGEDGKP